MSDVKNWVHANCRFAVFNPPQKGDRIELPNRPGQYFLVTDRPQAGSDPRGQGFWQTRVKDNEGREQMLSSDRTPSWSHFKGPNYQWHDQEIQQARWQQEQKQQAGKIAAFDQQYKFPDGQAIKKSPGRPQVLTVTKNATGDLAAFEGVRVHVMDVNYDAQTVSLKPVDPEFADLAMADVPAADVVRGAVPAMNPVALKEVVRLPNGEKVDAEQLMHMTPGLNRLARAGQVSLRVQVYVNYESGRGNGESMFAGDMQNRGISPENVEQVTQYRRNNTPLTINNGIRSPMGPWQGDVYISPPIPDDVMGEIAAVARNSQIQERKDGGLLVQSNALYKQMVSLGVLD